MRVGMVSRYRVPTMEEIRKIPWNGYNVVSTFSGGGGSCLGYRMAGYRVLWASEFVEEAQRTYRANHPTMLDTRDIRTVKGSDILKATGLEVGELDLFDGSPPCSAFSTAGSREKGWGKAKSYSDGKRQVVDDLFFEYVRLLGELKPKTFVAENVSGLIKGAAKGYFKNIIRAMQAEGYVVKAGLLKASWLGVPQIRERVIFQGVRNDLNMQPVFPKPFGREIPLAEAFEGMEQDEAQRRYLLENIKRYAAYEKLRQIPRNPPKRTNYPKAVGGEAWFNLVRESMACPCSTVTASGGGKGSASSMHPLEDRKLTIPEVKRIMSVPDDFVLTGTYEQQYERLGRMVPPLMMREISKTVAGEVLSKIK